MQRLGSLMMLMWILSIVGGNGSFQSTLEFDVSLLQTELKVEARDTTRGLPENGRSDDVGFGDAPKAGTHSEFGRSQVKVTVVDYPEEPVLDFEYGSSPWTFSYNPAYLPGSPDVQEGLLVRVQNNSFARRGHCVMNKPITRSMMAYTSIVTDDPSKVNPLGGAEAVVFEPPAASLWEMTSEDPRVVLHDGLYYMTYTGGFPHSPEPTRHQGIATTKTPLDSKSWQRMCSDAKPCVKEDGIKSGAMLPRAVPPHYMLVYDTRNGKDVITMAKSVDLIHWNLTDQTLIDRRSGLWDEGLVEPGPPPLLLSNGNYLALYNSARLHDNSEYHVGFVILDGEDPTKVLQRSDEPLLSWDDRPWMRGEGQDYLCNVPYVVFLAAARSLGADRFQLYFGGADASIGTAVISVDIDSEGKA